MTLPFVNRNPTTNELEQFRLILSTYQDGTGMLQDGAYTLPGWRDFERYVAVAFDGQALERKWIYDVLLKAENSSAVQFGISCKMRGTLRMVETHKRVTIEIANAAGEFWDAIKKVGLTQEDYHTNPLLAGGTILQIIEQWHHKVSLQNGGFVNTNKSFYLVLQWDRKSRRYQLFQFPIRLPDASTLFWQVDGRRLIGYDDQGILFEWYGLSGGQLKYYPVVGSEVWRSAVFMLEPLPDKLDNTLKQKAAFYFPLMWLRTQKGNFERGL